MNDSAAREPNAPRRTRRRRHAPEKNFVSDNVARFAALAVAVIAGLVYFQTVAPSVTWKHNGADSGDLAAAAYVLGIPHPPGYPLFMLIAGAFARLPYFEPAAGVGIFAALAGAFALWVLARAGASLIGDLDVNGIARLIPALVALGFAFAPALWSQVTVAEVYTLNLFFVCVILWAMVSHHRWRVAISAAAFGFGLAHHLSIVLLAPGALIALQPTRRDWRAIFLLVTPLLLYAYLPLRGAQHPAVNWGAPYTLDGFLWDVTAAPYRSYFFGLSLIDVEARLAQSAKMLFDQFTPLGIAVVLWGVARLATARARLALAFGISFALIGAYAMVYGSRDAFIYLLPAFAMVALWLMYGAADFVALSRSRLVAFVAVIALLALPLYNLRANFSAMDLSGDRAAFNFARGILERLPRDAVVFAEGDENYFALVYYRQAVLAENSSAVIVSQGLLQYPWYYDELRAAMNEVSFAPSSAKTDFHQRAVEIVSVTFAEGRTVCFEKSSPLLAEFEYEIRGELNCVIAERE